MNDNVESKLLTTSEVAKRLRVGPQTVRDLANADKLDGKKVGRQWRFPSQVIEEYEKVKEEPKCTKTSNPK